MNSTTRVDYREYYNPRSRRLVAERFRRDIDAFGYDFDAPPEDTTPREPPARHRTNGRPFQNRPE
jgi:hypothetical protein